MEFRILGPLEVLCDSRVINLRGAREQTILAMLLLDVDRVVPVDRLIDAIWDDTPPQTARTQVYICVSALRRRFASVGWPDVIDSQAPGYVIRRGGWRLDLDTFEGRLAGVAAARRTNRLVEAADGLRAALTLWRGHPLAGATSRLVQAASVRLRERQLHAVEEWAELELGLGRHEGLIEPLLAATTEHPYAERLHEHLMVALYRTGRAADALAVYRRLRDRLADELGLEPGAAVRRVEHAILTNAVNLAAPPDPRRPEANGRPLRAAPRLRHVSSLPASPPPVPPRRSGPLPASVSLPGSVPFPASVSLPAPGSLPGPALREPPSVPVPGKPPVPGASGPRVAATDDAATDDAVTVRGLSVPRQLPADVGDFTGRADLVARLADHLARRDRRAAPPVATVCGKGGAGKTTLAVHVAHQLCDQYPDGQLFADLRAGRQRPASVGEVLQRFLRALGLTGDALRGSTDELLDLYRTRLADRRVLVVLDDAAGADQVLPLLPGSPTCGVLVTARGRLADLPGVSHFGVDTLDATDALALLTRASGDRRIGDEPAAARELVALCGGLPLALRIAGARLAARRHWSVAHLVERLRDERRRLDELAYGGLDVRASLSVTYGGLPEPARALFRRLGLIEARNVAGWVAAAVLDCDVAEATELLESLVEAQLLDLALPAGREPAGKEPGGRASGGRESAWHQRYTLHDLVRVFAKERAIVEDPPAVRGQALARALAGWLGIAEEAHRRTGAAAAPPVGRDAARWLPEPEVLEQLLSSPAGWLESERQSLGLAVRQAAEAGWHELAVDLAVIAVSLYEARGYPDDWREPQEVTVGAVRQAGWPRYKARKRGWTSQRSRPTPAATAIVRLDT